MKKKMLLVYQEWEKMKVGNSISFNRSPLA